MGEPLVVEELMNTIEHLNTVNRRLWEVLALHLSAEEYEKLFALYGDTKGGDTNG